MWTLEVSSKSDALDGGEVDLKHLRLEAGHKLLLPRDNELSNIVYKRMQKT